MKLAAALLAVASSAIAQPVGFTWDSPSSIENVVGYRIEWGPQDNAEVPIYQTQFEVKNFPTGLLLPVSVYSVSTTTNSDPTTIYVYNIDVAIEESEDLTNWQSIGSVTFLGPRKANSFIRLRQIQRKTNDN